MAKEESFHTMKNKKLKNNLFKKKKTLITQLASVEKKNSLLTDTIDLDYLEMIYRKKFMVGKSSEKIYRSN